ncbi:hypothetical protein HAX54_005153, partial [Datura stramonium]|nr:hypothetical protein [Datura stramonium]
VVRGPCCFMSIELSKIFPEHTRGLYGPWVDRTSHRLWSFKQIQRISEEKWGKQHMDQQFIVWDHKSLYGSLVLPVGLKFLAKFGTVL